MPDIYICSLLNYIHDVDDKRIFGSCYPGHWLYATGELRSLVLGNAESGLRWIPFSTSNAAL